MRLLLYQRQKPSWEAPTGEQGKEKSVCPAASAPNRSELESWGGTGLCPHESCGLAGGSSGELHELSGPYKPAYDKKME